MNFTLSVLNPDYSNFKRFMAANFPEVEMKETRFSFGFYIDLVNVSLEDGRTIWQLWVDTFNVDFR